MTNDLLVERNHDSSMMDIGKNCSKCNQLDFLPFVCEYCKLIYCENHRKPAQHQCKKFVNERISKSPSPEGPSVASLFPNRDKDRARINALLKSPKPTTIESQFKVGDVKISALSKLNKFLNIQRTKHKKLFDKKKPNPVVEMSSLRKVAKGDSKIKPEDRIYIWCLYINVAEEELDKIDIAKQRKGMFVNKNWSIGKILDYLSDELRITNNNNVTTDVNERLNIFRLVDEKVVLLGNSNKGKELKNSEVLYLVRGSPKA